MSRFATALTAATAMPTAGAPAAAESPDGRGRRGFPCGAHLVLPAVASWATALVLLGHSAATGAAVAALLAAGAVAVAVPARAGRTAGRGNALIAVLGCAAAVAASVAFRVHAAGTGPVAELAARHASAVAEVVTTDDPRELPRSAGPFRRESFVVPARVEAVGAGQGRVRLRASVLLFVSGAEWRPLLPGQRVEIRGRFGPADPGELLAAVVLVRGAPRMPAGPPWEQRAAGAIRAGLREAADVLPPAQRGLLPGLVVGDVSRMQEQVRADFKAAGLSHLLAVSGANLAVVAGAAVALARVAGLPLAVRAVLALTAMVAFAVVARPSPSVLRALLMGGVAAVALGTGRSRDGVTALSVTVLGLVFFVPDLARSYGFALSVSATAGILVLAPRWRDRLSARLPRWLAEATAVAAAAQTAVTPVLVLMSGQLAPVAVPANLLAGPAVAPATLIGFVVALIAPLHLETARLLVRPAGLATGWIIEVAERAAGLPLGAIPWPGGVAGVFLLAVAVPLAVPILRGRRSRQVALAAVAGLVLAATLVTPIVARWPPQGWLLVACDVGQGDALLVAAGPGRAVVVDAGPDPVSVDRCLRSMGIRQVPLAILTHPHFDHTGGLDGVFRGREVGAVVVTPHGAAADEGTKAGEREETGGGPARRRVTEWAATPGASWRFGPSELTVIGPEAERAPPGAGEGATVNNASVVLHVRWAAGSALLSGDIETEAQAELLRRGLPPAQILKVPHHGSGRYDPAFFTATGARAALISVGAGNDYGHPAPSTLAALHRLGMRVYRTDLSGDLAVVVRDGALAVVVRGRAPPAPRAGPPEPLPGLPGVPGLPGGSGVPGLACPPVRAGLLARRRRGRRRRGAMSIVDRDGDRLTQPPYGVRYGVRVWPATGRPFSGDGGHRGVRGVIGEGEEQMSETQESPFGSGAFTPSAEDRESLEAWFALYDAHSAKVDVERMADMAMFPLNVVTDGPDGDGMAASWTRERFTSTMAEVMGGGEQGEIEMRSVRTPHFLTANLAVVITDATVTANGQTYEMRYADLLVKSGGRWVFQTMVQGGWADAWKEAPTSA